MKERVSYESQVLYVGPSAVATGQYISGLTPTQLHKVTRIDHTLDSNFVTYYNYGSRNPLGQFGVPPSPIDSTLEFEYTLADAQNEKWLGFTLSDFSTSAISGMLNEIDDEQNFYIVTTERGDAVTTKDTQGFLEQENLAVVGLGNVVIENYYIEASLGEIPSARIVAKASNVIYSSGASGIANPAVDQSGCATTGKLVIPAPKESDLEVDALRPSYISLSFDSGQLPYGGVVLPSGEERMDGLAVCSLDQFSLNLQLPRRINQRLGNKYAVSKPIKYPAQAIFSCSAKTKDIITGNLRDLFCSPGQSITVSMESPYTQSGNFKFSLRDAYLDSHLSQHDLVSNESVNLTFVAPLADVSGGPNTGMGFFLSGVAERCQNTTYGTTSGQLFASEATGNFWEPLPSRPRRESVAGPFKYFTDPEWCYRPSPGYGSCGQPAGYTIMPGTGPNKGLGKTTVEGESPPPYGATGGPLNPFDPYLEYTVQNDNAEVVINVDGRYCAGGNGVQAVRSVLYLNNSPVQMIETAWGGTHLAACTFFVADAGLDPLHHVIQANAGDQIKIYAGQGGPGYPDWYQQDYPGRWATDNIWTRYYQFTTEVTENYC